MSGKHIEAAAAALQEYIEGDACQGADWETKTAARIAITAYCESLASAGEDGVVNEMLRVYYGHACPVEGRNERSMRAALAVARLSMGEVGRDKVCMDWLETRAQWVQVTRNDGTFLYNYFGEELRAAILDEIDAARSVPDPEVEKIISHYVSEGRDYWDRAEIAEAKLAEAANIALRALCLTRDYVGEAALPALPGWEWYEAGKKLCEVAPDVEWAQQFAARAKEAGHESL